MEPPAFPILGGQRHLETLSAPPTTSSARHYLLATDRESPILQSRTVVSKLPETSTFVGPWKTSDVTVPVWPTK